MKIGEMDYCLALDGVVDAEASESGHITRAKVEETDFSKAGFATFNERYGARLLALVLDGRRAVWFDATGTYPDYLPGHRFRSYEPTGFFDSTDCCSPGEENALGTGGIYLEVHVANLYDVISFFGAGRDLSELDLPIAEGAQNELAQRDSDAALIAYDILADRFCYVDGSRDLRGGDFIVRTDCEDVSDFIFRCMYAAGTWD